MARQKTENSQHSIEGEQNQRAHATLRFTINVQQSKDWSTGERTGRGSQRQTHTAN